MPLINIDELCTYMQSGKICIYTIDTNIFYKYKFNFNEYPLNAIFHHYENINLKLSSFTFCEILKNYCEHANKYYNEIKKSLREIISLDIFNIEYDNIVKIDTDKECERTIYNFFNPVKKYLISVEDFIDIEKISEMYFNAFPPFENKENKKYEFQDALALNTLENYAARNKTHILVLSNDKGWNCYCKTSKVLYGIIKDTNITDNNLLRECIARFNYLNYLDNLREKIKSIIYSSTKNNIR